MNCCPDVTNTFSRPDQEENAKATLHALADKILKYRRAMRLLAKATTAELPAALVEVAIAHGRRHYSESGEPLATTLAVLECLQREGFVTVEDPATP